uniref:Carboxylic ester hydrolase n=1 Tax=Steinernema glaseri TaxID=37863 RepID=A0A1I7Y4T6_9BILA
MAPTAFLTVFLGCLTLAAAGRVDVNTSRGPLFGFSVDYGSNKSELYYGRADVFLGIPYVMQPVDSLRFHKPRKMLQFPGATPYDATKYGNICPQLNKPADMTMGEDCLYLNIISPNVSAANKYPVMVWIHGGAMKNGYAAQYGYKGAVRNLVSRGVVVVIIQYRIGTLGFFTTFTEDFPPNLGMLDQVEALRFVQEEIANFGGDPYRVTLFGQSAGGASVSAHLYSPLSQGLFQQGIMESGTVLTCFDGSLGFANLTEQRAAKYCNVTDDMFKAKDFGHLKSCMMNMDYNTWLKDETTNPLGWKIVQDDHFFPEVPRVQQLKRPNVPVLIGSNKDEWSFFEMEFMKAGITWDLYSRDAFETMFGMYATFLKEHEIEIEKMLEDVYRPHGTEDSDALAWLKITNDIFTSAGFTGFISRDIDWYVRNNNTNVYAYEYTRPSLVNEIVRIPGWNPVFHCAELAFIWMQTETWENAVQNQVVTPKDIEMANWFDIEMANWFGETWTNFAKYGFPTLDNSWKPVTIDNPKAYLEINDIKTMRDLYRGTDRVVWNRVIPSLVGFWPPERPNGVPPTGTSE